MIIVPTIIIITYLISTNIIEEGEVIILKQMAHDNISKYANLHTTQAHSLYIQLRVYPEIKTKQHYLIIRKSWLK